MTGAAHTETTARVVPSAGSKLKAARQAAGLSIDAVAQQLKLAPRQVTALEEDDWHRLPGRTFVRGFARNYARFVQLDPDAVLALLPPSDAAPALERPTLTASPRPMGELPIEGVAKVSPLRFVLPLIVLVALGVIAYYGLSQSQLHMPASLTSLMPGDTRRGADADVASSSATSESASSSVGASTTSTLPNPITAPVKGGDEPKAALAGSAAVKADGVTVLPTPSTGTTPAETATSTASTTSTAATSAPGTSTATSNTNALSGEVPLILTFKATSWAEVKDARGRVVLQMTGGAGMTQTVTATPPIELALGNAPGVVVTFRGQSLDLSPYTRGTVARVSLQ